MISYLLGMDSMMKIVVDCEISMIFAIKNVIM